MMDLHCRDSSYFHTAARDLHGAINERVWSESRFSHSPLASPSTVNRPPGWAFVSPAPAQIVQATGAGRFSLNARGCRLGTLEIGPSVRRSNHQVDEPTRARHAGESSGDFPPDYDTDLRSLYQDICVLQRCVTHQRPPLKPRKLGGSVG